jgi:hypothetical protein
MSSIIRVLVASGIVTCCEGAEDLLARLRKK